MQAASVDLRVTCPPFSQPVYVDVDMWEKVVLNLLSNALKFAFDGHLTVKLEEIGSDAVLSWKHGHRNPASELAAIFERFHRVEGAKGRTYEGSGIGLALIQDLAKLHSGSVAVSSEVGKDVADLSEALSSALTTLKGSLEVSGGIVNASPLPRVRATPSSCRTFSKT